MAQSSAPRAILRVPGGVPGRAAARDVELDAAVAFAGGRREPERLVRARADGLEDARAGPVADEARDESVRASEAELRGVALKNVGVPFHDQARLKRLVTLAQACRQAGEGWPARVTAARNAPGA